MKRLVRIEAAAMRAALLAAGAVVALGHAAAAGAEELWETRPSSQQDAAAQQDSSAQQDASAPQDSSAQQDSTSAPPPAAEPAPADGGARPPETVETIPVNADAEAAPSRDSTRLETIEVTSQKRVKAQRDIPGSVDAIRGVELEKMNALGMKDYLKLMPGVTYADQGNEESVPIIRGIATDISPGATQATTGVYLNEMPFADLFAPSSMPDINPFDLERVEVLKGPQGTLFGSGALAGAIRYIPQQPNHGVFEGKLSGTYSTVKMGSPSWIEAAAVNVPVFGDTLAFRGVGVLRHDGGLYDNYSYDANGVQTRNAPDADKLKQDSWRLLGSWNALDDLHVSALWFNQKTNSDGFAFSQFTDKAEFDRNPYASPRKHAFGGGNLTVSYDLPWARVFSSTNKVLKDNLTFNHQEWAFGLDQTSGTCPGFSGPPSPGTPCEYVTVFGDKVDGYTQEVRISSPEGGHGIFEWLVGGSYMHYGNDSWQYSYLGPDQPDPTDPGQVTDANKAEAQVFDTSSQLAEESALFGELTARLGDHLELTAGARDYKTQLHGGGNICGAQIIALFQSLCFHQDFEDSAKGINPKFSIRYIHDRNIQLYGLVAKGFQFGGFQVNPPAPGFSQAAEQNGYHFAPYKSSTLWNYEAGLRTEWLDRRLRWDLAFFYLDWTNLQLSVIVPVSPTSNDIGFTLLANVGRAHSKGVETTVQAVLFPGATWTSSASFMNAVIDVPFDANNPSGPVQPGTRLPGSPRFQWSNVLAWEHSLPYFSAWNGGFSFAHVYFGTAPDQIRAEGTIGGYGTLDGRLFINKSDSRYVPEASFAVNNITDVRGVTYHDHVQGGTGDVFDLSHFVPPRTMIFNVSWRY